MRHYNCQYCDAACYSIEGIRSHEAGCIHKPARVPRPVPMPKVDRGGVCISTKPKEPTLLTARTTLYRILVGLLVMSAIFVIGWSGFLPQLLLVLLVLAAAFLIGWAIEAARAKHAAKREYEARRAARTQKQWRD